MIVRKLKGEYQNKHSRMSSLIDKADAFISNGHPKELRPLLKECVDSKTEEGLVAVQRLARDMYGGMTYNMELKAPAAYCLPVWGERGLDALVENALNEAEIKNFALAFRILSPFAGGEFPSAAAGRINENSLLQKIISECDPAALRGPAKKSLNRLVMSFSNPEEIGLYAGLALQTMALKERDAIGPLFKALSLRWLAVGLPQIAEYEALIADSPTDEKAFHSYIERNPLLLDPLALRVWSKPDLHGKKEPDFVIQRTDNSYVVVEIETPAKALVTGQGQISAETTHAITQVLEYKSFLTERFTDASNTFPHFSIPEGLVVVGMEGSLNASQRAALRRENENRPRVRIIGFDALAERTKAITQNVIESSIDVDTARL